MKGDDTWGGTGLTNDSYVAFGFVEMSGFCICL